MVAVFVVGWATVFAVAIAAFILAVARVTRLFPAAAAVSTAVAAFILCFAFVIAPVLSVAIPPAFFVSVFVVTRLVAPIAIPLVGRVPAVVAVPAILTFVGVAIATAAGGAVDGPMGGMVGVGRGMGVRSTSGSGADSSSGSRSGGGTTSPSAIAVSMASRKGVSSAALLRSLGGSEFARVVAYG